MANNNNSRSKRVYFLEKDLEEINAFLEKSYLNRQADAIYLILQIGLVYSPAKFPYDIYAKKKLEPRKSQILILNNNLYRQIEDLTNSNGVSFADCVNRLIRYGLDSKEVKTILDRPSVANANKIKVCFFINKNTIEAINDFAKRSYVASRNPAISILLQLALNNLDSIPFDKKVPMSTDKIKISMALDERLHKELKNLTIKYNLNWQDVFEKMIKYGLSSHEAKQILEREYI